ncbi:hypothetical protein [Neoroseomonas lacus]|uniref:hypothetical protein n=1 Tax=Neoroseomonas lacus TaxID=287609 RepID=UPI001667FCD3|nr:hypothetical protein [Neoroseomonas lacus]
MGWCRRARPLCLPALATACALLLPGCAPDNEETTALLQHALASTQASVALAGGARPPALAATPLRPAALQPAWAPGATRQPGRAAPATAAALMGVTADQLRRMLGEPAIRRPEGAAEVWLYEAPTCRLDVILYAEGSALVVGLAAARALGGAEGVTESACLAAVATAPAPTPWAAPGPRA